MESRTYRIAKILDKTANLAALVLFLIMLLYGGYYIWYSHSLQNESFLSEELIKYKRAGEAPALAELRELNPDVVAWITVDGTNIDYPVVQGKDDHEYLNKTVLGEFSLAGSIFLSAGNSPDFSDPYNMTYGHHVEGGAMYADVLEFQDASFFKTHTKGMIWYPDADGRHKADRIEIFAVVSIDNANSVLYSDPGSVKPGKLSKILRHIYKKAGQKRDIPIDKGDRIVGLYTCEDASTLDRALLYGKLTPMSEEEIQVVLDSDKGPGTGARFPGPLWLKLMIGILPLILLLLVLWRLFKNKDARDRQFTKTQ